MDRHVLRYGNVESPVPVIWIKILLQVVKDNTGLKIILEMAVFCSSVWFGPSNTFPFASPASVTLLQHCLLLGELDFGILASWSQTHQQNIRTLGCQILAVSFEGRAMVKSLFAHFFFV